MQVLRWFFIQMDCKKFIQLVEEKKKRALEKKEASLKWEQKLEAAAKAKADAEAKESKLKASKRNRSLSKSDSESDTDNSDRRKARKRTHEKDRKHTRYLQQFRARRSQRNEDSSEGEIIYYRDSDDEMPVSDTDPDI